MKTFVIVVVAIVLLVVALSVVVGLQHAKRRKSGMAGPHPQVTGQGRQVPDTPPPPANR
ncbi:hypothetical protein [Buchananella hordeovulneris]|uniref:hypothetical protein n=1 Tax=Buchananella hordeovulneris TaxID=52770 RepID=UPI0013013E2F|nr:hypothetical protein [Buchananella hordeovulneris]